MTQNPGNEDGGNHRHFGRRWNSLSPFRQLEWVVAAGSLAVGVGFLRLEQLNEREHHLRCDPVTVSNLGPFYGTLNDVNPTKLYEETAIWNDELSQEYPKVHIKDGEVALFPAAQDCDQIH